MRKFTTKGIGIFGQIEGDVIEQSSVEAKKGIRTQASSGRPSPLQSGAFSFMLLPTLQVAGVQMSRHSSSGSSAPVRFGTGYALRQN
jgi:hypothetical protein